MSKLSVLKIKSITKIGMHSDGDGLVLKVQKSATEGQFNKTWIYRWGANGANSMGLGSADEVKLDKARDLAREYRKMYKNGLDPRIEREKAKQALLASQTKGFTFKEASEQYISSHKFSWRNPKHADQWTNTLNTYAFPIMGKIQCADITVDHVYDVLKPIWENKNETATRLRGRIETVLAWASSMEHRTFSNVASYKGNLQYRLPTISRRNRIKHHNAMQYDDLPQFISENVNEISTSWKALLFCILTATRTSETIQASWSEFDLSKKLWIIPKERMKKSKEHRVPLSEQAVKLLKTQLKNGSKWVFNNEQINKDKDVAQHKDKSLSNMAMLTFVRRRDVNKTFTVHGFRSTFRDWAAEKANYPREVCEQALAHSLADQSEAAYQRADYFDKRKALMQEWADYCFSLN